jgi:hypothetical protein
LFCFVLLCCVFWRRGGALLLHISGGKSLEEEEIMHTPCFFSGFEAFFKDLSFEGSGDDQILLLSLESKKKSCVFCVLDL